jgi:DNA helicase-2/ATP-dependent DNA helicase PcrA
MTALAQVAEKPKPTDEQVEIYDRIRQSADNLLINALAGGGKTSTLEGAMSYIREPTLYLAFNTSVVKEAEERQNAGTIPSIVKIDTLNRLGLRCWRDGNGKATTNPDKPFELLKAYISDQVTGKEDRRAATEAFADILHATKMAKHLGYIPGGKYPHARRLCDIHGLNARLETPLTPFEQEIVDDVLLTSIQASYAGSVDFDDQIYMPALFGGSFPRFPNVLVDEDQDLDPAQHALLDKLTKGRLVAVGDRWQAIYHFRGAETGGVDKLKTKFGMQEMPLSYSFRCPEAIVRAVHWHVPHMRWIKTGGTYDVLPSLDPGDIPEGAAIICRNNAPLFRAAFALLSRKRSVSVAGSDIGPKIIKLLGKVGSPRDSSEVLIKKIDGWMLEQLERTNAPASVIDKAECMKVFAGWGKNLEQAIAYAKDILVRKGTIYLSTGHKAKGMEWDTVYHLDKQLLSKEDQDLNLKYVITTRAKQELFEITTQELQW